MMSSPVANTIQSLYSTTAQRRIKSPQALDYHHTSVTSSGRPGTESSSLAPSNSSFFVVRPLPPKQISDSASIISDTETITNHSQALSENSTKLQSEATDPLAQFQQESKLKRRVSKMLSPLKGSMASQKQNEAWKPAHSPSRSGFSTATRGFVDPTIGKLPPDSGVGEGGPAHGNNFGEGGNVSGLLHSIRRRASASLITAANLTLAVPLPHPGTNNVEETNPHGDSQVLNQKPTRKPSTLRKQKSAGPLTTSGVRRPKVLLPETPLLSPMQFNEFSEPAEDERPTISKYLQAPARRMHDGKQITQTSTTSSPQGHKPNDDWTGEWNRPNILEVIEKLRTL